MLWILLFGWRRVVLLRRMMVLLGPFCTGWFLRRRCARVAFAFLSFLVRVAEVALFEAFPQYGQSKWDSMLRPPGGSTPFPSFPGSEIPSRSLHGSEIPSQSFHGSEIPSLSFSPGRASCCNVICGIWESYMFCWDFGFLSGDHGAKSVQRASKQKCCQSFPQVLRPVTCSWCAPAGVLLVRSLSRSPWACEGTDYEETTPHTNTPGGVLTRGGFLLVL